ncbi:hypothetical protein GCM10022226_80710 [Sphaerisporangium flaviroseum]|uniref:Core-binding (CB) domain-containing protein n=1 Tax=Sphaerisporangium flaviroseum TaxID=509199 RepID=A0ABP7JJ65_9ACTN
MVWLPERLDPADDSLPVWMERYLDLAVRGARSTEVIAKISRHLERFGAWIADGLGHDRLSAVTVREVTAWRDHLAAAGNRGRDDTPAPMAPATVNNHLAHLSALFTWITAHAPEGLLRHGDPTKKSPRYHCPPRSRERWPPPRCAPSRTSWTGSRPSTS